MKVVCIDNIEHLYMIKGKIYEVYGETMNLYKIKNEHGFIGWVRNDHFKDIRKIRDEKLNDLGI